MFGPLSAQYLPSRGAGSRQGCRVEAWRAGTHLEDLPVVSGTGTWKVDPVGGNHLSVGVSQATGTDYRRVLGEPGVELHAWQTETYVDGTVDEIPLGVFPVDGRGTQWGAAGVLTVAAFDRSWLLQRARFLAPVTTQGAISDAITTLVQEAIQGQAVEVHSARGPVDSAPAVWDRDRAQAVADLAAAGGYDVGFDRRGVFVIRDAPTVADDPVWTVASGDGGVMLPGTSEQESWGDFFNAAVVLDQRQEGTNWGQVVATDDDPASPTSTAAQGLVVPRFFPQALLTNPTSALYAARQHLARGALLASALGLQVFPCHALDRGDVVLAVLPDGRVQRHVVRGFTASLGMGDASMTVETGTTGQEAGQ